VKSPASVEVFELSNSIELIVTPETAISAVKQALNGHVMREEAVIGDLRSHELDEPAVQAALRGVANIVKWHPLVAKAPRIVDTAAL
jgi:hypothetical protein